MNKFKELNFRTRRWIFSKVLENTLFTIVLTALVSILLSKLSLNHIAYILAGLFILGIIYKIGSYEKQIKKVNLDQKSLIGEWTNNEFRTQITSVASVSNKALYLQFMDIPFTLNVALPLCYAFEFKAKALNTCFGWCINVDISGMSMLGYLFQYFPDRRNLSPVFLVGYNPQEHMTLWVVPDTPNSPITNRSIIVWTFPPPLMGEGAGGGGQDKDLLVPPPLHPLPPKGGEIFLDYVFSIMDSLVNL